MITIPNYDSKKYTVLLHQAWNELYEANRLKDKDRDAANNGKDSFSNLQHYFSYIQELVELDKNYIMMPIDEQPFVINANTRMINVPTNFANCGGVQSDSYAEIVTFTIDRYFDYQDLANVNIMVQWRNESSKIEGFSIIDLIDLKTYGAENKIRFGWPLTKDMTSAAGILTFAVRFFHTGVNPQSKKEELTYVLNTLASSIVIKPTLNINLNNPNLKVNENDYENFLNFVINSSNPSYSIPTSVEFITGLPKTAKLNTNDTLTLEAWANTKDRNVLIYEWYRKLIDTYVKYEPEGNVFPERRPQFDLYTIGGEVGNPTYVKYEGNWPPPAATYEVSDFYVYEPTIKLKQDNDDNRFDVITSMELYRPKDADGVHCWPTTRPKGLTVWTKDESVNPYVFRVYNDEWPTAVQESELFLYTHIAKLIFKKDGDDDILGEYFVRAINRITENEEIVNETFADSPTVGNCLIAGPNKIEFSTNLNTSCFLDTDNGTELTVTLMKDSNNPDLTYELRDYNQKETIGEGDDAITRDYTLIDTDTTTSNQKTFTVSDNGKYRIAIHASLNRHSDDALSEECSVYNPPVQIPGTMYVNGVEVNDELKNDNYTYDGENMIIINAKESKETYTFKVEPDFTGIDKFDYQTITYKWSRAVENEELKAEITSNMIGQESDVTSKDNNVLTVAARYPETKRITYYCDIYNTIELPNSTESKTAQPKTYIFVVE